MSSKRTKLRFTIFDDLVLLREILGQNPFEDKNKWAEICKNMVGATSKSFSLRTIKEHSEHLLTLFRKNDRANLRKSGTEEQYDEKEQLLQQISDLERDFRQKKIRNKVSKSCSGSTANQGIRERDQAAYNLSQKYVLSESENEEEERDEEDLSREINNTHESEDIQSQRQEYQENFEQGPEIPPPPVHPVEEDVTPTDVLRRNSRNPRNKPMKNNALEYLREKRELESKIKEKELRLEERKLTVEERKLTLEERKMTLEEAKFEIEKEERAKRLKLEIDERSHKIALEKQLADMNSILVKHLMNKNVDI